VTVSDPHKAGDDRIGAVLLNLGAPEAPSGIPNYIRRLLSDPDLVPLPWPFRSLLAALVSRLRADRVARYYKAIGGSPLKAQTRAQAEALRSELGEGFEVRYAFRYCAPGAAEVVSELASKGVRRLVAIPLYPQYSRSTWGSGMRELMQAARSPKMEVVPIRSFADAPGFVEALARHMVAMLQEGDPVLFCAHGLPMKIVRSGDPYLSEVEKSVAALASRLPPGHSHTLAFQSKVGRMEWTRPDLGDELVRLGRSGAKSVVVVPVSFVSENLETLYELDIEHAALANAAGLSRYRRVPVPGCQPAFIGELASLVRRAVSEAHWETPHGD
jgi:ferrochelatase